MKLVILNYAPTVRLVTYHIYYHLITIYSHYIPYYPIITCCIPTYPQDGGFLNGAAPKSSNHIYNLDPRAKLTIIPYQFINCQLIQQSYFPLS